jgi:hypothetical protein
VVCAVGAFAVATTVAKHRECRLLEQCLFSMHSKSGNKSHKDLRPLELAQEQKVIIAPDYESEEFESESDEESVQEDEAVAHKRSSKKAPKTEGKSWHPSGLFISIVSCCH